MSVEFMQKAFEISASDRNLTPADKLVLLRWAWKTKDPASPYEIKFRTVARELGLSRNAVKASVHRLSQAGYLVAVAVKVVAGPAFQTRERGQPVTPQAKAKGGQPVTRGGSGSDPQKGQPVTPIKKKKIKEGPAALSLDFSRVTSFQRAQILAGRTCLVNGQMVKAGTPQAHDLRSALVAAFDAEKAGAL